MAITLRGNADSDFSNGIDSDGNIEGDIFIGTTSDDGADSSAFVTRQNGANNFQVTGGGTVRIGGTIPGAPNIELDADGSAEFAGFVTVGTVGGIRNVITSTGGIFQVNDGNINPIQVRNTNNDNIFVVETDGSTLIYNPTNVTSGDIIIGNSDVNGQGTLVFSVTSGGIVQARTTAINQIGSERRIKKDIELIDPTTAWDTIKSVPYYSYKLINSDFVSYGPIVDEVPAEMVLEGKTEDEQGNIRTFDNAMLQARLFVALQEALKRIETLESRLSTLEGGNNP